MKKFCIFFMLVMLITSTMIPVFADETIGTGIASETQTEQKKDTEASNNTSNNSSNSNGFNNMYPELDVKTELGIDTVTAEDANNWLHRKGNDVISILITIAQYVCYAAFVIGGAMFLIGLFANKKMAMAGLLTLILAGIIYAASVCSPEIVRAVAGWAAS